MIAMCAFVIGELGPARYSFERSMAEIAGKQMLGHMMFLRLVAEIGIRFAWVSARSDHTADSIRRSIDALFKRDLLHLRAANRALQQSTKNVDADIATIREKEAPRQIDQLGLATPLAAQSYSMFRFASALVHPGFGLRDLVRGAPDMEVGLRDSMTTCIVLGAELLSVLAPEVEPPDIDTFLQHDILGYSPTAIGLRLRRSLSDAHGIAAPEIENVAVTIALDEEGWKQTLEAVLAGPERSVTVSATAPEPSDAYVRLERDALDKSRELVKRRR